MNSPQNKKCCMVPAACDQNSSLNTREEPVKDYVEIVDCGKQPTTPATEYGQYYKCCNLSPAEPNPLLNIDCCEKYRPCKGNFCMTVNSDCDDFELTPYGKEYVLRTGRLVSEHF